MAHPNVFLLGSCGRAGVARRGNCVFKGFGGRDRTACFIKPRGGYGDGEGAFPFVGVVNEGNRVAVVLGLVSKVAVVWRNAM